MADGVNVDAVFSGLKAVRSLRCAVTELFRTLSNGLTTNHGDERKETAFLAELQAALLSITSRVRDLESACTLLGSPTGPLSLGNTAHLSQDPTYDKTSLYNEMIKAYRWCDKVHEHSTHASAILTQNTLKRSNINPLLTVKRVKRSPHNGHNVPPQNVDAFTAGLHRLFHDMSVEVLRPFGGNSAVLKITLSRTLKALVILRGLIIEWVLIKGFNEEFCDENDRPDLWSSSKYKVFQKVTDNANAAMLHFYSPLLPELAVKSFVTWLHSYSTLFNAPCRRCGCRLQNNMPPTWRDVRNLDVFHEACRP